MASFFPLYFCSTSPDTPFAVNALEPWTGYFFRTVLRGQGKRCLQTVYQPRECPSSAHLWSRNTQTHGPKSGDGAGVGGTEQANRIVIHHTLLFQPWSSWVKTLQLKHTEAQQMYHSDLLFQISNEHAQGTAKNFMTVGTKKCLVQAANPRTIMLITILLICS